MILLTILTITLVGCGSHEPGTTEPLPGLEVSLTPVSILERGDAVAASGSITSGREAMIASRIMGQVTKKYVKAGDVVKKDETLLTLDDRTVRGQISQARGAQAQAQAALTLAETNWKRFRELFDRKAASQLELDMAEMQYSQAKGAVEQAEGAVQAATSMLDDAIIRAPFSGTVLDVMVREGDMVAPGYPVLRLADRSRLELVVNVKESDLDRVNRATVVTCDFPSAGIVNLPARIAEVISAADPMTHTFQVKLKVDEDPRLKSGIYGRALFTDPGLTQSRLYVPAAALVQRGQLSMVFTVEDHKAVMNVVRAGEVEGELVEILSGLTGDEQVVLQNAGQLFHGRPVEVLP